MEVFQKKARMEWSESGPSSQPGPEPAPRPWPATRREWQRLVDERGQVLVGAWERGVRGHLIDSECRTLDSLAGEGFGLRLLQECEFRDRQKAAGS